LVKRLLKAKANVTAANTYRATAMSEAAERADVEVLKALLSAGADVESPNAEGQTALMSVVRTNRVEAAKLLISRGADVNAREQWRGQTPLMWAAAQSQPEMVQLLIRHRAEVDARSTVRKWERDVTAEPRAQNRPRGGFTPLLLAAREGCVACAKILVEAKADIDLASPDGISPLLMAVLNGRFDLASYLIDAGANIDKWDWWGRSPLYSAVDYNTVPRGGRPDRPSEDQTSPLQLAEKLLKAGANPNLQLKLFPPYRALGPDRGADMMLGIGTTPLIRAAKAGDNDAVRLLLRHGARVDLPNLMGITPLMAAAGVGSSTIDTRGRFRTEEQCIESAKLLLAAGAKINATRDNGQTALHGAAQWGWNGFVQFLADNGINVNAADRNGIKAIDVALGKGSTTGRLGIGTAQAHPETAALLEKLAQRSAPVDTASLN
jgi:ankyrin repeat protein